MAEERASSETKRIRSLAVALAAMIPVLTVLLFVVLLTLPSTRRLGRTLIRENHVVETMTFVLALGGALLGARLALHQIRAPRRLGAGLFFAFFALGLFWVAGEEVSWGQQWLKFKTPKSWAKLNAQRETNLHNLKVFQNALEVFALSFGVGGLLGIALRKRPFFTAIAPPKVLLSWFLVIAIFAGLDFMHDYWIPSRWFDKLVNELDEVIEMLVAGAGLGYMGIGLHRSRSR